MTLESKESEEDILLHLISMSGSIIPDEAFKIHTWPLNL